MTMRITTFGEPKWTLRHEIAGSLRLQKGYEGGGNVTEGITFTDAWTFYHQQRLPVRANGQVVNTDEVFAAPPKTEFCLACRPPHGWLTVAIPASLLFQTAQEREFADSAAPQILKPPPGATRRFATLIERFLSAADARPELLESLAAVNSFESELLEAARGLFAGRRHSSVQDFAHWRGHVKSAVELALSQPFQSLPVSDLARRSGVPERSLRRAFQRCYGLSPMQWLRIYRLDQARRLFRASCPDETTVTQVAFKVGFWDLGRFAGSYRQLFGELPSETLRRAAPASRV